MLKGRGSWQKEESLKLVKKKQWNSHTNSHCFFFKYLHNLIDLLKIDALPFIYDAAFVFSNLIPIAIKTIPVNLFKTVSTF
jgi:hypothetical protein